MYHCYRSILSENVSKLDAEVGLDGVTKLNPDVDR